MLPIRIGSDLAIRLGAETAVLTPAQGFRLAEQLIRKSTRVMMLQEAVQREPRRPRPAARHRIMN